MHGEVNLVNLHMFLKVGVVCCCWGDAQRVGLDQAMFAAGLFQGFV